MTSLVHNRSRFGFSASLARLSVPRARLDRYDETVSTGPPSEEQPSCWISERSDRPSSTATRVVSRQTVQSRQSPSQQRSRPSRTLGSITSGSSTSPITKKVRAPRAWRCPRPCSLITDRCELHSRFRGVHASSCVSFRALWRRMNLTQRFHPDAQEIYPGDLLWGSCCLHSVRNSASSSRPACSGTVIHYHCLPVAFSCLSGRRTGEEGSAPWATTLPQLPVSMRTLPTHTIPGKSQFCNNCTAGSCLHPQRLASCCCGEQQCTRSRCGIVGQGSRDTAPSLLGPECT